MRARRDWKHALKILIWAPFLTVLIAGWFVAAHIEQGYYYLKGYSWNPIRGGYWHRETGAQA